MAGNPGAAAEVAVDLAAISQDINNARRDMERCADPEERRELRKYMTALMEKEARLAGTAASELVEVQQGCKNWPKASAG